MIRKDCKWYHNQYCILKRCGLVESQKRYQMDKQILVDENYLVSTIIENFRNSVQDPRELAKNIMESKQPVQVLDRDKVEEICYHNIYADDTAVNEWVKNIADQILQLIPQQKPTEKEIKNVLLEYHDEVFFEANRSARLDKAIQAISNLHKGEEDGK